MASGPMTVVGERFPVAQPVARIAMSSAANPLLRVPLRTLEAGKDTSTLLNQGIGGRPASSSLKEEVIFESGGSQTAFGSAYFPAGGFA